MGLVVVRVPRVVGSPVAGHALPGRALSMGAPPAAPSEAPRKEPCDMMRGGIGSGVPKEEPLLSLPRGPTSSGAAFYQPVASAGVIHVSPGGPVEQTSCHWPLQRERLRRMLAQKGVYAL